MMTDFVSNHIGRCKLTRLVVVTPVKTMLEVAEERGVKIDLLIIRTVEGSHRGLRIPARRACRSGEHNQRRRPILAVVFGEYVAPHHFCAAEHLGHELARAIIRRSVLRRTAIGRMSGMRGVL